MVEDEQKLIAAITRMLDQYSDPYTNEIDLLKKVLCQICDRHLSEWRTDGYICHSAMSAGERAIELLAEYGLVEKIPAGGKWTKEGEAFLVPR